MQGIPPARETDTEDVAWGLQTAEALWKRGERVDAVVWLRRAAQGAAEAADDDRALELARSAAELCDWMAALPAGTSELPAAGPEEADAMHVELDEPLDMDESDRATLTPEAPSEGEHVTSVPPADTVHAGMYDPWGDRLSPVSAPPRGATLDADDEVVTSVPPEHPEDKLQQQRIDVLAAIVTRDVPQSETEVSKPPPREAWADSASRPSQQPVKVAARPPPLPAHASRPTIPRPTLSIPPVRRTAPPAPVPGPKASPSIPSAAPVHVSPRPSLTPSETATTPDSPAKLVAQGEAPPSPAVDTNAASVSAPKAPPPELAAPGRVVLDEVEAFADLPDDARRAFASAATVSALGEGEEVNSFALAYILSGTVDVAATMVDAPATRLGAGAVLRSRGTIEDGVPTRLIGVNHGVVATWTHTAVEEAFRTCPWVEEDLRVAADRIQALVGITIGPLGERLDASIRGQVLGRLTMRTLAPGEVVVKAGEPLPGLFLVGVGELELVSPESNEVTDTVGCGEFLFPKVVLGAFAAPSGARAGSSGALILFGDRHIAQELLVTCPPLLEVFAGM